MIKLPARILLDTNLVEAGGRECAEYQGIHGNPTLCHVWHWRDEVPTDRVRAKEVKAFWGLIKERARTDQFRFCVSEVFRYESMERPLVGSRGLGYNDQLAVDQIANEELQVPYYGGDLENRKKLLRNHILNSKNERIQFLLKHFGNKQSQDCAHLFCAESAGIVYFLTMDMKFIRSFKSQHKIINSPVQVISPSDFCAIHSIEPVEQVRVRSSGRYDWQGIPLTREELVEHENLRTKGTTRA